jgi:hypothetical protein
LLHELVGHRISMWSQGGDRTPRDDGRLVGYDERWVKIENAAGELLYFPIANIRLIKPQP